MSHLKAIFGGADTWSAAQRYSFDPQGNVTGQTAISGMGAKMGIDQEATVELSHDGVHLG